MCSSVMRDAIYNQITIYFQSLSVGEPAFRWMSFIDNFSQSIQNDCGAICKSHYNRNTFKWKVSTRFSFFSGPPSLGCIWQKKKNSIKNIISTSKGIGTYTESSYKPECIRSHHKYCENSKIFPLMVSKKRKGGGARIHSHATG